ncbi:MAG: vanadium-dependent haloperoxidase [Geminicoccaceae bacterium]
MRKITSREHRETAAKIAEDRQHPVHVANGEERAYRESKSFMSFTKGLPHDETNGLVKNELDPVRLRMAIDNGFTQEFDVNVPLGCRDDDGKLEWEFYREATETDPGTGHRKWEAPTAGFVYDLQGPDAQAVTMPPAPPIVVQKKAKNKHGGYDKVLESIHAVEANPELVAEMAEVYWLALLRDRHLSAFDDQDDEDADNGTGSPGGDADAVQEAVDHLAGLDFYQHAVGKHPRRRRLDHYDSLTRQNLFRGHTKGERDGPYLSQFMLMGDRHLGGNSGRNEKDGLLQYGAITIDMKVRTATPGRDYMTHWNEWLDVQNGADVIGTQQYVASNSGNPKPFRFITTLRDLATYVHFDALYEAYLNACIWLLNANAPFDPNFRNLLAGTKHTSGFALFGGPHILSLMTEVATRGLKAVRFQKFNNHLRLRPEALAGLLAAQEAGALEGVAATHVGLFRDALNAGSGGIDLLAKVRAHNQSQNDENHDDYLDDQSDIAAERDLPLLPMAFPEGSPMHPSYGAGHATVAGACVTILKAFFDEEACLVRDGENGPVRAVLPEKITGDHQEVAFVPNADGTDLEDREAAYGDFLRVGNELNKLAANISIARNMAGVHYYSDYIDSLRMGEEIAIGLLQEQSILYPKDPFQVSLTSFDGKRVIIGNGEVQCLDAEPDHENDHMVHVALDALTKRYGYDLAGYPADHPDDEDSEAA